MRRPEITLELLSELIPRVREYPSPVKEEVEVSVKYEGYIKREQRAIERMREYEKIKIPRDFDFSSVKGLNREAVEKLSTHRPENLAEALNIPGVNPAHIFAIEVALRRKSA